MENSFCPIITAHAARAVSGKPGYVWIDARGGPDAYKRYCSGHIEGAAFVDLETDLAKKSDDPAQGGRHPLPDLHAFGYLLANLGIQPSSHVMVYDEKGGANAAARFWWMLRAAGHQNVQVLDGGYPAAIAAELPVSTEITSIIAAEKAYPVQPWQLPMVNMDAVAVAAEDKTHLVIDVREHYRYIGESEPIDKVAGHIPGAVNVPYIDNLEANGSFRSREALATLYRTLLGSRETQNVAVHCGSGVTACHTLLAMEYAGIKGVNLYVGSWSEWSRNERPVAVGDTRP